MNSAGPLSNQPLVESGGEGPRERQLLALLRPAVTRSGSLLASVIRTLGGHRGRTESDPLRTSSVAGTDTCRLPDDALIATQNCHRAPNCGRRIILGKDGSVRVRRPNPLAACLALGWSPETKRGRTRCLRELENGRARPFRNGIVRP